MWPVFQYLLLSSQLRLVAACYEPAMRLFSVVPRKNAHVHVSACFPGEPQYEEYHCIEMNAPCSVLLFNCRQQQVESIEEANLAKLYCHRGDCLTPERLGLANSPHCIKGATKLLSSSQPRLWKSLESMEKAHQKHFSRSSRIH